MTLATPTKQPFASLTVSIGDADNNGVADVSAHLRVGTLELPSITVNIGAGQALSTILGIFADLKLGRH